MACVGIITFQELGFRFAHYMVSRWDHLMVEGPIIGVAGASGTLDAFPQLAKGSRITAVHHQATRRSW